MFDERAYFQRLENLEAEPWIEARGLEPSTLEKVFSSEEFIRKIIGISVKAKEKKVEYGFELVRHPEKQKLIYGNIVSGELPEAQKHKYGITFQRETTGQYSVDYTESSRKLIGENELLHPAITTHSHIWEQGEEIIFPSGKSGDLHLSNQRRVAAHNKAGKEIVMPTIDLISMVMPSGKIAILGYHESLRVNPFDSPELLQQLEDDLYEATTQEAIPEILRHYGYSAVITELDPKTRQFGDEGLKALSSLAYDPHQPNPNNAKHKNT